ncbi:MAG TPA: aminotransferase class I/II-fold pyridoxal phosphate-dependent enzyme [Gemmataceae bacterium]|jgi:dTDP-4-amino-4,6-dideoxygalactose transaminase|nr:aminotransferase class I/II-fold pyridoxal phosphate-dependent enzyme [Gemmataceae bacterium]
MSAIESLPALLGGQPVRPQGPPDWPPADDAVREALAAAWRDGSWGKYHGGHVRRLEERLAALHGVEHALTCGSGTFAVELALRALKVGPGDEVVLAAYDYPGNFLAVHAVGAAPVLIDPDPDNWNISVEKLAEAFGPATRAVIASHLHGGLVPMREVTELAAAHGVRVVEDAAQAVGATVQGRPAGAWGDVGVLSFGGSKLLTAGRGGAVLTRHADAHQRARLQLHRGNAVCPLSELQAAVLLPQLDALPARHSRRLRAARLLGERLHDVPGLRPFRNRADGEAAFYKLGFQFDPARFGLSRARLVAAARAEGVALDEGFRALHAGRSPSRHRCAGPLGEAERAAAGAVVLHHPVLLGSDAEVEQVAVALEKIQAHAARLA